MWFTNQTSYSRCHSDQLLYSSCYLCMCLVTLFVYFMLTYTYSATFNFVFVRGSVWIYQNWKDCMTRTILETLYWKRKQISSVILCGLVVCRQVHIVSTEDMSAYVNKVKQMCNTINKPGFLFCSCQVSEEITFSIFRIFFSEYGYCS